MTEEETSAPGGAASLVGLFAPPDDTKNASDIAAPGEEDSPAGNAVELLSLFSPSAPLPGDEQRSGAAAAPHRRSTLKTSNSSPRKNVDRAIHDLFQSDIGEMEQQHEPAKPPLHPVSRPPEPSSHEHTALLSHSRREDSLDTTAFGDLLERTTQQDTSLGFSFNDLFMGSTSSFEPTPKASGGGRKTSYSAIPKPEQARRASSAISAANMPRIQEDSTALPPLVGEPRKNAVLAFCENHLTKPTTYVGAGMFLLYHVVFCLALGSAIQRPQSEEPVLGLMAKMAACGTIFAAPVYLWTLGRKIPALYPTADLFLAPFLSHLATIVDTNVAADTNISSKNETQTFLATFAVLSGSGMLISGALLILAAKFKLANMGSFLPYPVLCGFFSAVAILMWSLAFSVDNNGKSVQAVFGSGDMEVISTAMLHHAPSLAVAIMMKYLGPKNPFYVAMLVVGTIAMFYIVMALTGTTLAQAKEDEWFWSHDDLVYNERYVHFGFDAWAPPAPFGVLNSILEGKVHWGSVKQGLPTSCALAFLYLIRCSLHGLSLKKNVSNLVRIEQTGNSEDKEIPSPPSSGPSAIKRHARAFSEAIDIEAVTAVARHGGNATGNVVRAKDYNMPLGDILLQYGRSHFMSALVGSFGVVPSVAAAPTMFSVGAEGLAPQCGSLLLLAVFYLTNFELVSYIPKAAFSCLIVLAFIDIILTWFIKSYQKTHDKFEWLVVPIIVVFAFVVGLLNAVFLGIAISTFIFVAAFFRSGVVKFLANGLTVRSTIERSIKSSIWLDQHGHSIQILVLQNYLFFGNASSIQNYIANMFTDPVVYEKRTDIATSPLPKFVILDLSLVTGMDTSTVDVFSDIKKQTSSFGCKLFLAGVPIRLRNTMSLGGVKPESGERSKRMIRFFPDLDSALGKAEDMLLSFEEETGTMEHKGTGQRRHRRLISEGDNGFRYALRQLDEQHGKEFSAGLVDLQSYTTPLHLAPGECLFNANGGPVEDGARGLFFIEQGIMKIERDANATLTRAASSQNLANYDPTSSLTKINARMGLAPVGISPHLFRLARIGPGWVVGTLEGVCGMQNSGRHTAVSPCRLHHLPFSKIEEIEETNPVLALRLYKLLSHLMGRRQEITVGQLATMHSIMTAPPITRPRGELRASERSAR